LIAENLQAMSNPRWQVFTETFVMLTSVYFNGNRRIAKTKVLISPAKLSCHLFFAGWAIRLQANIAPWSTFLDLI
jgi:hypothetical protein